MSEEITPEYAAVVAREYLSGEMETDSVPEWARLLITALVALVEAREAELLGLQELRQIQERDAQIVALEQQRDAAIATANQNLGDYVDELNHLQQQRDAAVAVLRAAKGPQLVPDAWSRTAQLDVGVSEALVALGAEEAK